MRLHITSDLKIVQSLNTLASFVSQCSNLSNDAILHLSIIVRIKSLLHRKVIVHCGNTTPRLFHSKCAIYDSLRSSFICNFSHDELFRSCFRVNQVSSKVLSRNRCKVLELLISSVHSAVNEGLPITSIISKVTEVLCWFTIQLTTELRLVSKSTAVL